MDHEDITPTSPEIEINRVIAGEADVAAWAKATTRRHGIIFTASPVDAFADAVSRLSDAGVLLDCVERELLAIERAGIVTGRQGVLLHAAYLRQKR